MTISVIIPCFNEEKYIAEAIQSVLNQTRPADEIIVVDDCSADKSFDIVLGFDVKLYSNKKNKGIGFTRQKGIEKAKGDYIAFLSGDDMFQPNNLEAHMRLAETYPKHVQYSDYYDIFQGQIVREFKAPYHDNKDQFVLEVLAWAERNDMFVNFSTVFAPKKCFEILPIDKKLRKSEDLDWVLKACRLFDFKHIPEPLTRYRRHPDMVTAKRTPEDIISTAEKIRINARKWWKDKMPKLKDVKL